MMAILTVVYSQTAGRNQRLCNSMFKELWPVEGDQPSSRSRGTQYLGGSEGLQPGGPPSEWSAAGMGQFTHTPLVSWG